jgi:hypothetical protein
MPLRQDLKDFAAQVAALDKRVGWGLVYTYDTDRYLITIDNGEGREISLEIVTPRLTSAQELEYEQWFSDTIAEEKLQRGL